MADDWDLYAVVRSCTNAATTSTSSSTITDATAAAPVKELGEPFVTGPPFQIGDNSPDFPGFVNHRGDAFQGIGQIYKELIYENTQPQHTPTASSNCILQEFHNQQYTQPPRQQQIYPQPQQVMQPQQHLNLRHGTFGSSLSFPCSSPQPIRPRRRKNQNAKMIHQMTQEELSADLWAWRKYGQKPIKRSPYPRNYYRCSTSKGCIARKQVERCPTDPNMYVVSYSGEHSHPRPTHRSSLAGSSRSKSSAAAAKPTSSSTEPINTVTAPTNMASSIASCSSSSPASSFSPTTPITEGESAAEENADEGGDTESNNIGILLREEEEDQEEGWTLEDDDDDDDDGPDEDDILIPNTLVTDDLFKGLQFKK